MKLGTIVITSFIAGLLITIIGAWMKITHATGAKNILTIGIIATAVFIVAAIYEVRTSPKIDNSEKTMWTIAFIFFSGITGLVYILMGRRRIA